MERQERLKALLDYINSHDDKEYHFDDLYQKLIEEFNLEMQSNSNMTSNQYLNNLRQTRDKQARSYLYMKAKRPRKGAISEFRDFVSNFRHDVSSAIHR